MQIIIKEDNDFVNNVLINPKIADEELFEYRITDREDLIDNLIMWISECGRDRASDKQLMKDDLKYLIGVADDYIFSSISTNEYIVSNDDNFEETCNNLLELNNSLN